MLLEEFATRVLLCFNTKTSLDKRVKIDVFFKFQSGNKLSYRGNYIYDNCEENFIANRNHFVMPEIDARSREKIPAKARKHWMTW